MSVGVHVQAAAKVAQAAAVTAAVMAAEEALFN